MSNHHGELKDTSALIKIGRNERCICGSGKKYKKCCLNNPVDMQDNKHTNRSEAEIFHPKPNENMNKVLLSICVPSYNRGKRAYDNIVHNLTSSSNDEIEVVLSNNGTQNESKAYYGEIERIKDDRLKYFAFDQNQGVARNFCKVAEMATGKFILLLSDEDLIDFSKIDMVLEVLRKGQDNLAVVKISPNGLPSTQLAQKGEEALLTYMLTSNYMSGLIFNRTLLTNSKALKYVKSNLNNQACMIYPHMIWELILSQYGNVVGINDSLVIAGEAETSDLGNIEVGEEKTITIVEYATLESRLKQHQGFLDVIKDLEVCKNNFDILRKMYLKLSWKTIFLVSLSINTYFNKSDMDLKEILIKAYMFCIKGLNDIYCLKYNKLSHYPGDLNQIGQVYNQFLSSLIQKTNSNN